MIKQPYIEENTFMCYNHTHLHFNRELDAALVHPALGGGSAAQEYSIEKICNILDCKVENVMGFIPDDKE